VVVTITVLVVAALIVVLAFLGLSHRIMHVKFPNGDLVQVRPASFCAAVWGSQCSIKYTPLNGKSGTIHLWQDFFRRPIVVIPASRSNVLLCLYEFDTGLYLLKIDANRSFEPLPATASSALRAIVCASAWEVRDAKITDWQQALKYLKEAEPRALRRSGLWRLALYRKQNPVVLRMESQIKLMVENGSTQWPVTMSR